jgi:hypothetical protein
MTHWSIEALLVMHVRKDGPALPVLSIQKLGDVQDKPLFLLTKYVP